MAHSDTARSQVSLEVLPSSDNRPIYSSTLSAELNDQILAESQDETGVQMWAQAPEQQQGGCGCQ